jgi:modulator of FtsH protease HflK
MISSVGILMSLNDPGWGNRGGGGKGPNQGPPDLEQVWADINKRLSGIFGKKGGKGGGDSGNGSGGKPPFEMSPGMFGGGISILLGLVVVVWAASGFYIVDAAQRGIVTQFGRFKETTEPGLRWRLPFPIQAHELVNLTGVRTVEIGYRGSEKNKVLKEALMLTDDENIINIQFAVQWVLKDPMDFVFTNRHPEESVTQIAETAMREVVGKSKMNFVLYEGREQIGIQVAKLIQEILDRYKTGILVSRVTLQNAQPPEQVQASFDDAVKAGQDRERQKNEGQAYANDVIPKARGTAARLMEEANGYRQRVIATAEGDASRFRQINTEYAKAPDVTRSRMYLETMQQIFSNTSKVMIDAKAQGNLLYLPLDKLVQAAGASVATSQGGEISPPITAPRITPPVSNEVPPQLEKNETSRSRESLRSREREVR